MPTLLDGNKRVAPASALIILEVNDDEFHCPEEDLHFTMMQVAKGEMKKDRLTRFFEEYAHRKT